jgi:tetratricopeptide (TPR) repeat protein
MNFFKKLFGSKDIAPADEKVSLDSESVKSIDIEIGTSMNESTVTDFEYEFQSGAKFKGLDNEFIDLIYFPTLEDKVSHINNTNKAISSFDIKIDDDFTKFHIKIDESNASQENPIPFLIESLLIQKFDVKNYSNGKVETNLLEIIKGIGKVQSYYSASSFICRNIILKINAQFSDFSFEENLYNEFIKGSQLNNFAKISAIYCLGSAHLKSSDYVKAENYFNLIETMKFELEDSNIANFCRKIGEDYVQINEKEKALKWLEVGLNLNPKLGVKRLIAKLEMDK